MSYEEGGPERQYVRFVIPSIPPSSNSLYQVLFNLKKTEMKPEMRLWKTRAKEYVLSYKVDPLETIGITLRFYSPNWVTKDKKIKKTDIGNREKILIDSICEKQGWDDSQIWEKHSYKNYSEKEYVEVIMSKR